jgi:hypothetical protein
VQIVSTVILNKNDSLTGQTAQTVKVGSTEINNKNTTIFRINIFFKEQNI